MVEPPVIDRDVNVNGRRGSLNLRTSAQHPQQSEATPKVVGDTGASSSSSSSSYAGPSGYFRPSDATSTYELNVLGEESSNCHGISSVSLKCNSSSVNSKDKTTDTSPNQTSSSTSRTINNCDNITNKNINRSGCVNSDNVNVRSASDSDQYVKNLALHNRRLENLDRHISTLSNSGMAAFRDVSYVRHINRTRERQLEALRRVEERLRFKNFIRFPEPGHSAPSGSSMPSPPMPLKREATPTQSNNTTKNLTPKMAMFILDISTALTEECFVTWLPIKSVAENSPDDMILYTLVVGNAELIMFGGIQKDAMSINQQAQSSINISNIVSNSLYFISPPRTVI